MGQPDRQGYEGRCLVTSKTKHSHLILHGNTINLVVRQFFLIESTTLFGWQLFQTGDDTTCFGVENWLIISYLRDDLPCYIWHINNGMISETRGDEDDASGHRAFSNQCGIRVLLKETVQDGVTDLIAQLVWMTFRNRL